MSSVRQIAKNAGVSVATVSRTLNDFPDVSDQTRSRVLAAARRAGYRPNTSRKVDSLIGLAYPGQPVNAEFGGFDAAILSGVTRGVNERKFDVAILNVHRDKLPNENYTQFFRRKGVRGVLLRSFADSRHACEAIAAEGFPHVVLADHFADPRVNFIHTDSSADSRAAVEHLIHLGHRRIGLVIHMVADSDHEDRRRAFLVALESHGIAPEAALCVEIIADMNGGASAINRLMSLPHPPTAVFITDPLATLGALRRAQELRIDVPGELSVVGFDDTQVRKMTFPMCTAVCQDAAALGQKAAEWLTRRLSGEGEPVFRVRSSTCLEINHTTGAPGRWPVRVMPDGQRAEVNVP